MFDKEFPSPAVLNLPVEPYKVEGHHFGTRVRSRILLLARHLGDDVLLNPGTPIHAIGDGKVVWAEVREGSQERRNWGGIVIIGHKHKDTDETFFSLYGHLANIQVKAQDIVKAGQNIASVAKGSSPENGWWNIPHVHFGVYIGPWMDNVLPGYARPFEGRTKYSWWRDPRKFIEQYNSTGNG